MAVEKPDKPTEEWELINVPYGEDSGTIATMSLNEYKQGRNMTGEPETLLGSIPDVHKEDWLLSYFTRHIIYIEQMLDYLDEQISGGS